MPMHKYALFGFKVCIMCFLLGIVIVAYVVEWRLQQPNCGSYRRQHPAYSFLHTDYGHSRLSIKYKLWVFGREKMLPDANRPSILMIPGHGGGHGQFVDMADLTIDMFNVFAMEHNGEYTGFHGTSLSEQSEFIVDCIQWIRRATLNNTVSLFGHSMGGIAIRYAELLPGFVSAHVPLMVTFATAHQKPPISIDSRLAEIYSLLKSSNGTAREAGRLVSFVNSNRDLMVSNELSVIDGQNIYVTQSECFPDHLSILRCKCVSDLVLDVLNREKISGSGSIKHDMLSLTFRKYGVLIFSAGFQLSCFVLLAMTLSEEDTDYFNALEYILTWKPLLCVFSWNTLVGYLFYKTWVFGIWSLVCIGPNIIFQGILQYLTLQAHLLLRADDCRPQHKPEIALIVACIIFFAPFPYAFLILNLMICLTLVRMPINRLTFITIPLAYLQIIYAPALLVWIKNVSIGWITFSDIDILRSAPLGVFVCALKSGNAAMANDRLTVVAITLLILYSSMFSIDEIFRMGDAFSVFLLYLVASTLFRTLQQRLLGPSAKRPPKDGRDTSPPSFASKLQSENAG